VVSTRAGYRRGRVDRLEGGHRSFQHSTHVEVRKTAACPSAMIVTGWRVSRRTSRIDGVTLSRFSSGC